MVMSCQVEAVFACGLDLTSPVTDENVDLSVVLHYPVEAGMDGLGQIVWDMRQDVD